MLIPKAEIGQTLGLYPQLDGLRPRDLVLAATRRSNVVYRLQGLPMGLAMRLQLSPVAARPTGLRN